MPALPSLLIVDDDPLFRTLTRLLLESRGCEVAVAGSCAEALEMLPSAHPRLALVDMVMPDRSGLETIQALRSAEGNLQFIACSGHDRAEFGAGLSRLHVSHFLAKPFTVEELVETMREAAAA